MIVERYSHVMHIVSNVEGKLQPGLDALDVLRATFPAGTVSLSPKVRAMEIIDELEPVKRGIYAGAVGYLGFHGDMDLAIAIRTGSGQDKNCTSRLAPASLPTRTEFRNGRKPRTRPAPSCGRQLSRALLIPGSIEAGAGRAGVFPGTNRAPAIFQLGRRRRQGKAMKSFRIEHDLLGEAEVPTAYWGIHTLRAGRTTPSPASPSAATPSWCGHWPWSSGRRCWPTANSGRSTRRGPTPLSPPARKSRWGKLHDQFVVDVIQGGAGTSTNMNANEVIANRALELLGHARGEYGHLHPINHVNMSQSTNDVYPTALRVATCFSIRSLLSAMAGLREAFAAKAEEFRTSSRSAGPSCRMPCP